MAIANTDSINFQHMEYFIQIMTIIYIDKLVQI